MSERLPTLFVSHGAPTLAIEDGPARRFLAGYGAKLPRPAAIAVVSAHWESRTPRVSGAVLPRTIHDFGGFPEEMYRLHYDAPGAPELAAEVASAMRADGLDAAVDPARGLDHGAWVPLMLMYPNADIPAFQVSVPSADGPAGMERIGRLLAPFRERGVMVLASGSITHNLRALDWRGGDVADPGAKAFADWIDAAIERNDRESLRAYRRLAPDAVHHHPTEEHLLPLFAAIGATAPEKAGRRIHSSATFGSLMMDAYAFP